MKSRFYHMFFFIGICIWMMSCGNSVDVQKESGDQKKNSTENTTITKIDSSKKSSRSKTETKKEVIETTFDPTLFIADTTLYLNKYHIIVGKEKFDLTKKEYTAEDLEFNPIIVYFANKENDSVVNRKKFEENVFGPITSFHGNSDNYLTLISFGGGSGYLATIYKFDFSAEPNLLKVVSYSELSAPLFSKDGSELLLINGIWDMSANGDEGHFGDHKYTVSTVNLTTHKFTETLAGTTHEKYPSTDVDFSTEKILKQIHQKEPQVFKGIDLDKYSF